MKTAKPSPTGAPFDATNNVEAPTDDPLNDPRRGLVFMTISLFCFTANTLLLRYLGANREIDPSVTLLFRAIIGGMIVLTLMKGRRPPELRPVFREPLLIWRGIFGIVGTASYYWCIPALGAGKASLLGTTYVLFGAVFAAWFLREHLSRSKVAWLLIAFVGTAMLTGFGNGGVGGLLPSTTPGSVAFYEAFAIVGAIAAAATVVIIRHLTTRHSIATIFLAQCAWIALAAAPFAFRHVGSLNASDYAFLSLAAVCAGYGQLAMNEGYRMLSVAAGSSVQMALPVMAAIGGIIIFGEMYTALQVAGAVLILTGTWQVAVRK